MLAVCSSAESRRTCVMCSKLLVHVSMSSKASVHVLFLCLYFFDLTFNQDHIVDIRYPSNVKKFVHWSIIFAQLRHFLGCKYIRAIDSFLTWFITV